MMNSYITKNIVAQVKDLDTVKGIVSGYFSAFGNIDSDGDMIMPGAYKKTIQENGPDSQKPRIYHLLHHDWRQPLNRPHELYEDNHGLFFRTKISLTSWGKDALQLYIDKVVREHSVGIDIVQSSREQDKEGRQYNKLIELKMWEGSTVTWGANDETPTTDVKSILKSEGGPERILERMTALSKALRNGNYTDETFALIEIELQQIKSQVEILINELEPGEDPTPGPSDQPSGLDQISLSLTMLHTKIKLL